MSPLAIYKFKISKIANFYIFRLIKQYNHFRCISSYIRSYYERWDWYDRATSIFLAIVVTGLLVLMHRIGLKIKIISTDVSSYISWASEEGSHATLIPLGRFYAFTGRAKDLEKPGGGIALVLGKAEAELKIEFSDKYGGWCLHCWSWKLIGRRRVCWVYHWVCMTWR